MTVGTLQIAFYLHDCRSLKAKRSVVRKLLERTRAKFNVSAAEVEDNDAHSRAVLAFVTVGNNSRHVNSMLDKILEFVDSMFLAEIVDHQIELIQV